VAVNNFIKAGPLVLLLKMFVITENIMEHPVSLRGPGSSVGIATDYELDGPGIELRWKRDFSHTSRTVLGPTQPLLQHGSFQGVKRPGVVLTTHPF
jgi:hypothetical protein